MRRLTWIFLLATGCLFSGCQNETAINDKPTQYDFDRTTVGSQATGWVAAETHGQGTPAMWRIIKDGFAPSPPHVMAIVATENTGQTYNLMIANSGSYRDLIVSTYLRAGSGQEDQGGGLLWRARDANNYYVARWNPLENNLRIYVVKNGRRKQLASTEAYTNVRRWQHLTVRHIDNTISVTFNDLPPLEVEDRTFTQAGKVGLWSKADAATYFDGIKVKSLDLPALENE